MNLVLSFVQNFMIRNALNGPKRRKKNWLYIESEKAPVNGCLPLLRKFNYSFIYGAELTSVE